MQSFRSLHRLRGHLTDLAERGSSVPLPNSQPFAAIRYFGAQSSGQRQGEAAAQNESAKRKKRKSKKDPDEEMVADSKAADKVQDEDQEADSLEQLQAHHVPDSNVGNPKDDKPGHGGQA